MTILNFQNALMEEVGRVLKGIGTKNVVGEIVDGANLYAQNLPVVQSDDEDETKFFPYAIIKVYDGKTEDDDSPWTVTADIHLGVHDPDEDNQGHQHVAIMIQRIVNRFAAEPLLDHKYRAQQDMEWALQDEETFPFFFGGVRIKFSVPKIGRGEPVYGS